MIEELFINKWCYLTYRYILLDGSVMVRRYRVFVERIEQLRDEIAAFIQDYDVPCQINGIGSLACLYFTNEAVIDYETAKISDVKRFGAYFHFMLNRGIYIGPSQFEAMFLSYAHTDENIQMTLDCVEQFFRQSK